MAVRRLKVASGRKRLRLSMSNKGVAEAKGKLDKMKQRVTSLRPPLARGVDRIMTLMSDSFRNQSDPKSKKWAPLAKSTKENRARSRARSSAEAKKILGNIKILDDTGRLKDSLFAIAKERSIQFGSNVGYLAPHQLGTGSAGRNHNVHIPQRMVAPVEKRAGRWVLIRQGKAKTVFDRIEKDIRKHVAG